MFFERHRGGERAVLVQLQLEGAERDLSLMEFEELVGVCWRESSGCTVRFAPCAARQNLCGRG